MRIFRTSTGRAEEGSLLVIALVVLGVIALSTLYLSLVLLSEIRSTRYADNGIVAHYTAESGAERGLWRVKIAKQLEDPCLFSGLDGSSSGSCTLRNNTGLCAADDDGAGACEDPERVYDFTKAVISAPDFTVYDVPQNVPAFTDIFDPLQERSGSINTSINQIDVTWYVTSCSGSAKLETTYTPIQYVGGSPQSLQSLSPVTRISVCGCGAQTEFGYTCSPAVSIPGLFTNSFYRIAFRSLDAPIKKLVMTASGVSGSVSIPSQVEIKTTGTYREARASVTARSLWKDVISGLFNYIVFSEESLIKDTATESSYPFSSRCGFCSDSTPSVQKPCSSDSDCTSGTCTIANTGDDEIDSGRSQAFCSNTTAGETYPTPTGAILQTDNGSCSLQCNGYTYCGDGYQQTPNGVGDGYASGGTPGNEQCDLGPANSDIVSDTCRKDCRNPYCGDGVKDNEIWSPLIYAEECDDENASDADACYSPAHVNACKKTVCGDGIIQDPNGAGFSEQCDGSALGVCPSCIIASCTCGT